MCAHVCAYVVCARARVCLFVCVLCGCIYIYISRNLFFGEQTDSWTGIGGCRSMCV